MQQATPVGRVSPSGTYSGNLISVMAANAALNEITAEGFYEHICSVADRLYPECNCIFERAGIRARVQGLGARFGIYFGITEEVRDFRDTFKHDGQMAADFARACANRGVYFHSYGKMVRGRQGVSASHTLEDIDEALDRIETAVRAL